MADRSVGKDRLETTLKTLPADMQEKIRGLAAVVSENPQPSSSELLPHCLEQIKHGNLAPMLAAIKSGTVSCEQADDVGNTLLHIAVWRDDTATVKELLEIAPIDLRNSRGQTALHLAVARGALPLTKQLLDRGADIDAKDQYQYTPLHTAVQNHRVLTFLALAQRGADLTCVDINGSNLAHWAANENDLELLRVMKAVKVPLNARNNFGLSPLHMAAQGNAAEAYWFLVDEGLDPGEKSKEQKTALEELERLHGKQGLKRLHSVRTFSDPRIPNFSYYYFLLLVSCACYYYLDTINYTAQYLSLSLLFNVCLLCLPLLYL